MQHWLYGNRDELTQPGSQGGLPGGGAPEAGSYLGISQEKRDRLGRRKEQLS